MREIKFRAWVPIFGVMDDVVNLDLLGAGSNAELRDLGNVAVGNLKLVQYTGLQDKNGVEIYEGDIVRYQYPQKQLNNHQQLCKVVYEPKAAAFLLLPGYYEPQVKYLGDIAKSNRQYDTRTYELCEVIGNIYENPELLTPELSSKEKDNV